MIAPKRQNGDSLAEQGANSADEIDHVLSSLRRKSALRTFLRGYWITSIVSDLLILLLFALFPLQDSVRTEFGLAAAFVLIPMVAAALSCVLTPQNNLDYARLADARLRLQERVFTALELRESSSSVYRDVVANDAATALRLVDTRSAISIKWDAFAACIMLVLTMALVTWHAPEEIATYVGHADHGQPIFPMGSSQRVRIIPAPGERPPVQVIHQPSVQKAVQTPPPSPQTVPGSKPSTSTNQKSDSQTSSQGASKGTGQNVESSQQPSQPNQPGNTARSPSQTGQADQQGSSQHSGQSTTGSGQKNGTTVQKPGASKSGSNKRGAAESNSGKSGSGGSSNGSKSGAESSQSGQAGSNASNSGKHGLGPSDKPGGTGKSSSAGKSGTTQSNGSPGGSGEREMSSGQNEQSPGQNQANQRSSSSSSSQQNNNDSGGVGAPTGEKSVDGQRKARIGAPVSMPVQGGQHYAFRLPKPGHGETITNEHPGKATHTGSIPSSNVPFAGTSSSSQAAQDRQVEQDPQIPAGYRTLIKQYFGTENR